MKFFHRTIAAAVLAMIFGFAAVALPAQAQTGAPGVWASAITLQNQSEQPADVVINFYDTSGNQMTESWSSGSDPIPAQGSVVVYMPTSMANLGAGQYSAVVNSNQEVLASVNTASTNSNSAPWTAFAYDGFNSADAGETLYFPGQYKNFYSFFSEMVIQNAGAADATLTAVFSNPNTGAQVASIGLGSVAPNAAKTFATADLSQLPSGNSNGIFSVVVTATSSEAVRLVGVGNIWRTSPANGTASYSAFTGGTDTIYAPSLLNNFYNFATALTIQNVHPTDNAVVTLEYGTGHTPAAFTLSPGEARVFYQPDDASLPSGNTDGLFSAKATTVGGSIVGLVSQSMPAGQTGAFASYNAIASAAATVKIPNINSDFYGYFTAVTVQNAGDSATNVTINYASGQSRTFNNIAAGGTVNIVHLNSAGDVLPFRTSTAAEITSSNGNPLVAVVQHNTEGSVAGYDASKVPSDFLMAVTGVSE